MISAQVILYNNPKPHANSDRGTGKFTSILADRPENYEIIAVEPHADMRKVLEGKALKGVRVLDGAAVAMPAVETGWADAVVVAQV